MRATAPQIMEAGKKQLVAQNVCDFVRQGVYGVGAKQLVAYD
jgi:hypothetical protein